MLPMDIQENTYLFVSGAADIRRRVLAHEIGHGLTNQPDPALPGPPVHVFFPTPDDATLDNDVNLQRRITHDTEANARMCRAPGPVHYGDVGNRLLPGCP